MNTTSTKWLGTAPSRRFIQVVCYVGPGYGLKKPMPLPRAYCFGTPALYSLSFRYPELEPLSIVYSSKLETEIKGWDIMPKGRKRDPDPHWMSLQNLVHHKALRAVSLHSDLEDKDFLHPGYRTS